VQGLTSAFLSAGAGAVLAALWPVDDQVTAELMAQFYRSLEKGETLAVSLQQAQAHLWADPAMAHPFFWAGFVLTGDGSLRLDLPGRRNRLPLLTMGVILAGLLGFLLWAQRRKKTQSAVTSGARLRPR
jgi:hypothetical protein